jgi:hypothetical protein
VVLFSIIKVLSTGAVLFYQKQTGADAIRMSGQGRTEIETAQDSMTLPGENACDDLRRSFAVSVKQNSVIHSVHL